MPLYEYRCTACDRLTEKRQKFSDPELTDCPFCGGPLERTITAPAVQFKGGGWYADGYGSKKPAASGSGDGSKSESKGGDAAKPASANESAGSAASAGATPAAPTTAPSSTASPGGLPT